MHKRHVVWVRRDGRLRPVTHQHTLRLPRGYPEATPRLPRKKTVTVVGLVRGALLDFEGPDRPFKFQLEMTHAEGLKESQGPSSTPTRQPRSRRALDKTAANPLRIAKAVLTEWSRGCAFAI